MCANVDWGEQGGGELPRRLSFQRHQSAHAAINIWVSLHQVALIEVQESHVVHGFQQHRQK